MVHESEIDMVVEPASRLFEKYVAAKAEDASDIIALAVGISILTIPRVVIMLSQKKGSVPYEQKREAEKPAGGDVQKFAGIIPGDSFGGGHASPF
ncbi:MAG TPA: hypothetical protein VLH15_04280 [Dehalococcoidales bacterium]|nr:hypothetical protein [Dehalococcoidales bacterium]